MKHPLIASSTLLALCLALPAVAQDYGSGNPASGDAGSGSPAGATNSAGAKEDGKSSRTAVASRQDRKFVEDAAIAGMAEIQLGQIATQRAQHPAVRDYGNQMVNDHTTANRRLMTIAATLGITPPEELDFRHRRMVKKLGKAEGREFDEDYIDGEVKDHKKMMEIMEEQISDGENPDLKQLATDMLPRIREHQQMAERLKEQLKQQKE